MSVLNFKIYPERSWAVRRYWFKKRFKIDTDCYFDVNIFDTIEAYNKHRRIRVAEKFVEGSSGCFFPAKWKINAPKTFIGEINLSRPNLTWEILPHELGHAIAYWLMRKGIKTISTDGSAQQNMRQEYFCDVLGSMFAQFTEFTCKNEIIIYSMEMTNKGRKE